MIYAITWMILENIMLSESGQTKKTPQIAFSHLFKCQNR